MKTRLAEWHGISPEIAVYVQCWVLSLVLHGATASLAAVLFGNMRLPQPESFRLKVSMVDDLAPDADMAPPSEPGSPPQTPVSTSLPHPSPAMPLRTTPPITAPPSQALPDSHVETSHHATLQGREDPERPEVPPPEPRQPDDRARDPASTHGSRASEPTLADDHAQDPVTAHALSRGDASTEIDHPSESPPSTSMPAGPASVSRMVAESQPDPSPGRETTGADASLTKDPTAAPPDMPTPPLIQGEHAQTALPNQIQGGEKDHQSQSAAGQMAPGSESVPKRDHGWLISALRSRVLEMQRYPVLARSNHWEGRVVLRIVIGAQGQLRDLKLVESSGHHVLDQDAESLVRQVFPLQMTQTLAQPHLVVSLPIIYRLDR